MKILRAFAVAAAATLGFAASSQAATLTFDRADAGYTVTDGRIVSGNCATGKCLALNKNETTTITAVGGGTFSLSSFWFQLLGKGNPNFLTVTTDRGSQTFDRSTYQHNTGHTVSNLGSIFSGISYLTFSTGKGGNVRVDDVAVNSPDIAPVPLPASGVLLLAGLAGLAVARRRKSASA